jgi:predicted small secreted protein
MTRKLAIYALVSAMALVMAACSTMQPGNDIEGRSAPSATGDDTTISNPTNGGGFFYTP